MVVNLPEDVQIDVSEEEDDTFEITPNDLSKRTQYMDRMLTHFWKRWKSEYLLELRQSHSRKLKASGQQTISEGDIVIVEVERVRRPFWKLGIVEQVIPGRDGHVRGALVKVGNTDRSSNKLLCRPIQHLYPLEVGMNKEAEPDSRRSNTPESDMNDESQLGDPDALNRQHLRESVYTDAVDTNGVNNDNDCSESGHVVNSEGETERDDCCEATVIGNSNRHGIGTTSPISNLNDNAPNAPKTGIGVKRPKRRAAVIARDRITAQALN